jgi:hypothetical protein
MSPDVRKGCAFPGLPVPDSSGYARMVDLVIEDTDLIQSGRSPAESK